MFPRFPSVFYEAHLAAGGELNVAGASAPGAPGILIGHNRHIAWGITASMADTRTCTSSASTRATRGAPSSPATGRAGTPLREVIAVKGRPSRGSRKC